MKKIVLPLVIILLIFVFASNSMAWTLVYANDSNGNAISGNIQKLINAVKMGKEVRFLIIAREYDGVPHISVAEAETIWVRNNNVYAQNTSLIGSSFQGDELPFNQPAYYAFRNVSTTGVVFYTRWRVGEHTSEGDSKINRAIRWFVQ